MSAIVDEEVAPPEELSLRGQIERAIAETNARNPVEEEPKLPLDAPKPEGERARDEAGKFVKEEGKKRETLSLPAKPLPQTNGAEGEQPTPVQPALKAPESWSAPLKAKFGELPPEVQQEISRREAEMHRKFTEQDQDRTFGKQIRELTQPYMATILSESATPQLTYQEFLKTAYALRTATPDQKRNMLLGLAAQFNVPLNLPQQGQFQQSPQPQNLEPQIQSTVEKVLQAYTQRQEAASLQTEIEAFAASPGHEHFETVKPIMAALLEAGTVESLQDAYDQAVWARPDIRSTLAPPFGVNAEEKRLAELKSKTAKARQAAGSVTGGPGAVGELNGSGNPNESLRDTIRAAYRAAQGRV